MRYPVKAMVLLIAMAILPTSVLAQDSVPQIPASLLMRQARNILKLDYRPKRIPRLERIVLPPKRVVKYTTKWWEYFIYIPIAYVTTVLVHESGHAVMFKAYGWKNVTLHGPKPSQGLVAAVSAKWPRPGYRMGVLEKDVISGAGVAFTSLTSIMLTTLLRSGVVPEKLKPFLATTSLMMMFDRFRYCLSTTLSYAFKKKIHPGNDVHSIMTNHFKSKKSLDIAYGVLGTITILEIALRWPEIRDLIYMALGRKVSYKPNVIYVHATPAQFGTGATFSLSGKF